jgi:alpha-L-fucosidase
MKHAIALCSLLLVSLAAQDRPSAPAPRGPEFPPELVAFGPPSVQPLLAGTGRATWDRNVRERGWVMREGGLWHLWYTGYNDERSPSRFLGYATSPDGLAWTRWPGNPLTTVGWVEDMCVVARGGTYYMFAEGKDDIAHLLTSTDRVHWQEQGPLDIRRTGGTPIADGPRGTPTVWVDGDTWWLFYEREDLAIFAATSKDLKVWTNVSDEPVLSRGPEAYDKYAVAFDQVIRHDGRYYAYYHASALPKWGEWSTCLAVSDDLVHWRKYPGNPVLPVNPAMPGAGSGMVVRDGAGYRMYTTHPDVRVYLPRKGTGGPTVYQPTWDSIDARPTPSWFSDAKFGIFIHWGTYSVPAYAPVLPGKLAYAEWYWNAMTAGQKPGADPVQSGTWAFHQKMYGADYPYERFAGQFRAELFDPDHWADVFARSGAKYVALTSKHHEGFALWPSAEASKTWGRPWNAVETGPKRDVLGDLTEAVRRKGLKMGYYYSLYEWYNPLWLNDKPRYIAEHMVPQFKDLVTRYRPSIIFSDGEWDLTSAEWRSPELLAWLFNESPVKDEVVINDRWGKDSRHRHGGYWTTEYTAGMSGMDHPWEESRGMGFSYGYNRAERLEHYRSARNMVMMLVDLVSRGGNLLLDIGPDGDGTIPVVMEERLIQMGEWLAVNGEAIYGTRPWTTSRQWSAGAIEKVDYNKEYASAYDVMALVDAAPGKAAVEAFFTAKGRDVYAILPRWPGRTFRVQGVTGVTAVRLLGSNAPLTFTPGTGGISVTLPPLPASLRAQPAWVLKISR